MSLYRKKPVVIEAQQFIEGLDVEGMTLARWCGGRYFPARYFPAAGGSVPAIIYIETMEGTMEARPGDWIIKGVRGEFYPVKPDIFGATYEPADGAL